MSVVVKKKSIPVSPSGVLSGAVEVAFPARMKVDPFELTGHPRNPRSHTEDQIRSLMESIKSWGWTVPAVVTEDLVILAGHGRVEAAKRLGLESVEVAVVSGWDEFKRRAYVIADNQLALMSYWDWGALSSEVDFLSEVGFSLDLLGMSTSSKANLSAMKMANAPEPPPGSHGVSGSMIKKYLMSPFSVLSVTDPWWLEEKTVWLTHGIVQADLACILDIMVRWFCPSGGGVTHTFGPSMDEVLSGLGCSSGGSDFLFIDGVTHDSPVGFAPSMVAGLSPNRFAGVVIPGNYHPKTLEWIISTAKSSGLRYYNEMVVSGVGHGTCNGFQNDHSLVLLFVKGDEREAASMVTQVNTVSVPRKSLSSVPVITDPDEITPIIPVGDIWMKRDDFFAVGTARGGKVRSCLKLSAGAVGLTTAGSRASPQVNIVAQVAKKLGVPASAHLPEGELSPCVLETFDAISIVQHKTGYNSVIIKRAKDEAKSSGWLEVPFGMECDVAVNCTRAQVAHIPDGVQRLVIPVGSGMSLAGVLWGLKDHGLSVPVLGVSVGDDPTDRLDKYAPPDWADMVELVKSDLDYHTYAPESIYCGVQLDPVYEAKTIPFLLPGDLLWIVGIRSVL